MRRAFVSHSTADDGYVAEMESFLRATGFEEVFNDASAIRPDEEFWSAIEKGIAECDTLVVVLTAASNASEWVKREVACARDLDILLAADPAAGAHLTGLKGMGGIGKTALACVLARHGGGCDLRDAAPERRPAPARRTRSVAETRCFHFQLRGHRRAGDRRGGRADARALRPVQPA